MNIFGNYSPVIINHYPFPIYIDHQMEREGYIPQNILIDYARTHEGMRLVFKNPDFEK